MKPGRIGAVLLAAALALPAYAAGPVLTLAFAGDIVLDGTPGQLIAAGRDPFEPFAPLLRQADFRIANLECVVATSGDAADKNFTFRADPRTLPVLRRHFDAVSLANNHSGDFGRAAFGEMLGLLDAQKVRYFGGGRNLGEAHRPLIVEQNGLRIALLGYNEFMPRSFEATADGAGVAWSEDEQVSADIRAARRQADIVIPFMHWGWENEARANVRQRELARIMIDAGADAVIGGHPHVTQDVELIRGKPVIYSIGNFMIDALDNAAQSRGWLLLLTVDKSGVTSWQTRLANIGADGVPTPGLQAQTPCWQRDGSQPGLCHLNAIVPGPLLPRS